ncbi:MAG: type I-C CRISPR-associated protein Cas5 [Desulfobacteraceae bacterium 4484_190.1]|nr:MAG: type I-C CRISPR-associated protein Cas5 [Desulfobacteraceae bacterium 4484_190.1]
MEYGPLEIKVWGDLACFTRPEMKVERVSYPVITPSAARGLLEAIFWKPEFAWQIREIRLLKPIRYFSILRNEVNHTASHRSAQDWQKSGGGYFADEKQNRAQRHTLALRDVAYVITADQVLKSHANADPAKYRDQFRRRVTRGQYHHPPYLGCREFAAMFGNPDLSDRYLPINMDLGLMLFDLDYEHDKKGRGIRGKPRFFQARFQNGVMYIDPNLYC